MSSIDYHNSLLLGSIHDVTSHLHQIHKNAAQVTLHIPKYPNIATHLKSLHWLPVKVRSTNKIACLCYHCHSSTAPSYVTDMLQKKPSHTRNTRSNSHIIPLLHRPAHSKATLGDLSFSVWISIPNDVRHYPLLPSFRFFLKVLLSRPAYNPWPFSADNWTHVQAWPILLTVCQHLQA